jgi:thioredoxin 1
MRILLALTLLAAVAVANAAGKPYDEAVDAKAEIRTALVQAGRAKLPVLVVFGANWCGDCQVLDMAFQTGASAPLIHEHFEVVKVNVGKFDRNVDIAASYGLSLQNGIPAVVVLSPQGKVVYATRAGELADARNMGDTAIFDFFARVAGAKR